MKAIWQLIIIATWTCQPRPNILMCDFIFLFSDAAAIGRVEVIQERQDGDAITQDTASYIRPRLRSLV